MEVQPPKKKVIAYIDGFNLYYGLCESKFRRFLWLDLPAFAKSLLRGDQELVFTKYFTARISGGKPTDRPAFAAERNARRKRQNTYLDALGTLPKLQVFEGQYFDQEKECKKCKATWMDAEEKMTDVQIATEMIVDAFANRFDVALLVSGDSDLVPPIKAIRHWFPHKRINVAFPPSRSSARLLQEANGRCVIYKKSLSKCQLPEDIATSTGFVLKRPGEWC
jgi:uncharacterized LabA/DUF88 family protein